jgi:imidazolonepropionase-like amidohydrolase
MSNAEAIIFRGARIFDGESDRLIEGHDVVIAGAIIQEVIPGSDAAYPDAEVVNCGGRVLMPGLIDAHVHVYLAELNLTRLVQTPMSYLGHHAATFLHACLDRGFTTVRDVGGADVGLARAIRDGLLQAVPRLFYGGRVISQTGGHGDFRPGDSQLDDVTCCGCGHANHLAVVADGVDAVRLAVREELRRGASHVKIMASGGIASPTDSLERSQYSDEEIRAAVDEATRAGSYVAAHCHPAQSVRRAAELGVRSIEHATLVDREAAEVAAARGSFAVPTMATIFALAEEGKQLGLPAVSLEKLRRVSDKALESLHILKTAGVKMGFGTDLLGPQHVRQCTEFSLRAKALPAIDILRSACSLNAELICQAGTLGCIRKGAAADLLLVNGNPLDDISILARSGDGLAAIVKAGEFHKRAI